MAADESVIAKLDALQAKLAGHHNNIALMTAELGQLSAKVSQPQSQRRRRQRPASAVSSSRGSTRGGASSTGTSARRMLGHRDEVVKGYTARLREQRDRERGARQQVEADLETERRRAANALAAQRRAVAVMPKSGQPQPPLTVQLAQQEQKLQQPKQQWHKQQQQQQQQQGDAEPPRLRATQPRRARPRSAAPATARSYRSTASSRASSRSRSRNNSSSSSSRWRAPRQPPVSERRAEAEATVARVGLSAYLLGRGRSQKAINRAPDKPRDRPEVVRALGLARPASAPATRLHGHQVPGMLSHPHAHGPSVAEQAGRAPVNVRSVLARLDAWLQDNGMVAKQLFRSKAIASSSAVRAGVQSTAKVGGWLGAGEEREMVMEAAELRTLLQRSVGLRLSALEIREVVRALDTNGDGRIQLTELHAALRRSRRDAAKAKYEDNMARLAASVLGGATQLVFNVPRGKPDNTVVDWGLQSDDRAAFC